MPAGKRRLFSCDEDGGDDKGGGNTCPSLSHSEVLKEHLLAAVSSAGTEEALLAKGAAWIDQVTAKLKRCKNRIVKELCGSADEQTLLDRVFYDAPTNAATPSAASPATTADKIHAIQLWIRSLHNKPQRQNPLSALPSAYLWCCLRLVVPGVYDTAGPKGGTDILELLLEEWHETTRPASPPSLDDTAAEDDPFGWDVVERTAKRVRQQFHADDGCAAPVPVRDAAPAPPAAGAPGSGGARRALLPGVLSEPPTSQEEVEVAVAGGGRGAQQEGQEKKRRRREVSARVLETTQLIHRALEAGACGVLSIPALAARLEMPSVHVVEAARLMQEHDRVLIDPVDDSVYLV
eukprot:Rhum_TRINITY_DN13244_c2_g1::Rhum_TRINITY_DN13244_c2_g1_i1::g.57984::m.57984